jgi:hypothetical protein
VGGGEEERLCGARCLRRLEQALWHEAELADAAMPVLSALLCARQLQQPHHSGPAAALYQELVAHHLPQVARRLPLPLP